MQSLSPSPFLQRLLIAAYAALLGFLKPEKLYSVSDIRRVVARYRFLRNRRNFKKIENKELNTGTGSHTIEHNERELRLSGFKSSIRPARLISIISSLPRVYDADPALLKVLSVGPRTEMEIMSLLSIGLDIKNIDSIDLISSSPHIRVGDMHDSCLFPRSHYDIILFSWVLNYSSQPEVALDNAIQSLKPRGLIALANTHTEELTDLCVSSIDSVDNLLIVAPSLRTFTTILRVEPSQGSSTFMWVAQAPDSLG